MPFSSQAVTIHAVIDYHAYSVAYHKQEQYIAQEFFE